METGAVAGLLTLGNEVFCVSFADKTDVSNGISSSSTAEVVSCNSGRSSLLPSRAYGDSNDFDTRDRSREYVGLSFEERGDIVDDEEEPGANCGIPTVLIWLCEAEDI